MQVEAKLAEIERRIGNVEGDLRTVAIKVEALYRDVHGSEAKPSLDMRLDRIEQRSLTSKESKALTDTRIASWATLAAVLAAIVMWAIDKMWQ